MTEKGYNGWANWETWNVALWLGNDEGIYRAAIDAAKRANHHSPIDADMADAIVLELLPSGTPDFASEGGARCYAKVDWEAIADDINEMAGLEDDDTQELGEREEDE